MQAFISSSIFVDLKKKSNHCGTLLIYFYGLEQGEKSQGIVLKHYSTIIISCLSL